MPTTTHYSIFLLFIFVSHFILLSFSQSNAKSGGSLALPNGKITDFLKEIASFDTALVSIRTASCSKICESVDQALEYITKEAKIKVGTVIANDVILKSYKNTFKLSGYPNGPEDDVPLFFIFKFGYPETYQGPSDFQEMVSYFKKMKEDVFASARDLATMDQKHRIMEDIWHTSIIVYLKDYNNYDLMRAGYVLLKDGVIIYFCKTDKIAKSLGLTTLGDYLISQPFSNRITGNITKHKSFRQFIHFVRNSQNRALLPVTGSNVISIFKAYERVIIAFVDDLNKDFKFLTSLHKIASKNQQPNISFVYTEVKRMEPYLRQIGVSMESTPILLRLDTKMAKRTVFDNAKFDIHSDEDLEEWVKDQFSSEPTGRMDVVTSQEEPEDNATRPLKVVTNKNFASFSGYTGEKSNPQVFYPNERLRLVVFSRPNCPHCIELEPIIYELANAYHNNDHVQIGKFDTLVNDLPRTLSVPYLPTIFLFKYCPNNKGIEKLEYPTSAPRTFEELKSFIEKNRCETSNGHDEF